MLRTYRPPLRRAGATITLRGLTLVRFLPAPPAPGAAAPPPQPSPLAGIDAAGPGASVRLEDCVLIAAAPPSGGGPAASSFWASAATAGALGAGAPAQPARARAVPVDYAAGAAGGVSGAVRRSVLLLDPGGCFAAAGPGTAAVYDTGSFAEALSDPLALRALVAQNTTLGTGLAAPDPGGGAAAAAAAPPPLQLLPLAQAPPLARRLVISGCPGAALDLGGVVGSIVVGAGGELVFGQPLTLLGPLAAAAPLGDGGDGGPATLAPAAVRVLEGGSLALLGVQLSAPGAQALAQQLGGAGAAGAKGGGGGGVVVVANWSAQAPTGGELGVRGVGRRCSTCLLLSDSAGCAAAPPGRSPRAWLGAFVGEWDGGGRTHLWWASQGATTPSTLLAGRVSASNLKVLQAPPAPGCPAAQAPGPTGGSGVGGGGGGTAAVAAADAGQLRRALQDPAVRLVLLTGPVRLAPPAAAGGPWGGGGMPEERPGPLVLERSVEIRSCVDADGSGGGQPMEFDFADGVGVIVVAGGAVLRLSGNLLLRPCAGGAAACAAVWPAVPGVALGPGSQLQLEVRAGVRAPREGRRWELALKRGAHARRGRFVLGGARWVWYERQAAVWVAAAAAVIATTLAGVAGFHNPVQPNLAPKLALRLNS
jgi:hypothetical protein